MFNKINDINIPIGRIKVMFKLFSYCLTLFTIGWAIISAISSVTMPSSSFVLMVFFISYLNMHIPLNKD